MVEHGAVAAVLLSAFLHAVWNLAAKRTPYKGAFIWFLTVFGSVLLLPFVIAFEWAELEWSPADWLFPLLSIVSHALYSLCLAESYRRVPFAIAYPVSRGLSQVLIVAVGLVAFGERPALGALAGVLCLLAGIQGTADGDFRGRVRMLVESPWPLLVAICICAYTTIDHRSVQVLPPMTVCLVSSIGQSLLLAKTQLVEFRLIPHAERRPFLAQALVFGGVSTGGYCLFLWAQHVGGLVSLVAPLRESSILVGLGLSAAVLREPVPPRKFAAGLLIVCGIFLIRSGF